MHAAITVGIIDEGPSVSATKAMLVKSVLFVAAITAAIEATINISLDPGVNALT